MRLRVFGSLDLSREDGTEVRSVLAQPKRTALLAYLALARPPGFQRRDSLLALFWPEHERDRARHALNQAVYTLRRSLGAGTIETRGKEEVGLADGALSSDAGRFDSALRAGDRERALELYRGELLEGFHVSNAPGFERWLQAERERYRRRARTAALELADAAGREDDLEAAARWSRRALEVVPADEAAARRLMRALDGTGDRAGALRAYEGLVTRLERTLGVDPSPETQALAARVRERSRERPWTTDVAVAGATSAGSEAGAGRTEEEASAPAPDGRAERRDAPGSVPGRRAAGLAAGVLLLLLVIGGVLVWQVVPSPFRGTDGASGTEAEAATATADAGRTAIAVLPFLDLSSGSPDPSFGDGLAEELLHALARTGRLDVVARTSSFRFRDSELGARAIGDSLGVDAVLEASVRRSGDRVRITAQLVDTERGLHLWSGSYDRRLDTRQLFEIQQQIARAITDSLERRLGAAEVEPAVALPTRDLEAYSLHLRARHAWNQRTPESFRRALELYRRALERDSAFAEAWAGLASVYVLIPSSPNVSGLAPELVTREQAVRRARRAAERALELDPDLPEGHAAMGQSLRSVDARRAETAFRRAIALNPSYATARQWLAFLLATQGRQEEALTQMRRAQRLDPLSVSINGDLGRFLYYAGDFEAAVHRLRRTLELGTYPQADWFLALALAEAGRGGEARRRAERLDPSVHGLQSVRRGRAVVAARTGRPAPARELAVELAAGVGADATGAADGERRSNLFDLVTLHAALSDADRAADWLQRLERLGVGQRLALHNQPYFAELRADPRAAPYLRHP